MATAEMAGGHEIDMTKYDSGMSSLDLEQKILGEFLDSNSKTEPTPAPTPKVTRHSKKDGASTKDDGKKLIAEFCSKLKGANMELRPKADPADWDGMRWWKVMENSKNNKDEIGNVGFLADSCAGLKSVKIDEGQCKEALSKVLDSCKLHYPTLYRRDYWLIDSTGDRGGAALINCQWFDFGSHPKGSKYGR